MPTAAEIEAKFWSALKSDMTMMVGLHGIDEGHTRPMTAQLIGVPGPIWFFAAADNSIVEGLASDNRAVATFAGKSHQLFAAVHGTISLEADQSIVDQLWNPFVASWFEGGKSDPQLRLLRLNPDRAELWLDGSSIIAGMKMLFGMDPKDDYKDHVAKLELGSRRERPTP